MRGWLLRIRVWLALLTAALTQAQTDAARVTSVSPPMDLEIRDHQPVRFTVTIHYVLVSVERAIVQVYTERYANGPDGCDHVLPHHTEGGAHAQINRGEGDVTVHFDWHESKGPISPGPAFLGFGINFWTDRNGRTGKGFARFGTSFCRPVTP
jgi:hypothetical protein